MTQEQAAMAQKVVQALVDDLDGSPAVQMVRFGYAGRYYEIELNEAHAAELDDACPAGRR